MAIDSLCATLRGKPVSGDDGGGKDEAAHAPQPLLISHSALSKCECRDAQAAPLAPLLYWSCSICIHGARELSYP